MGAPLSWRRAFFVSDREIGEVTAPLRIVIVGGGTAGWMSAAAFARVLHPARYSVTLIESDEIGTVGVGEATLPHIRTFNDLLGVDEAQFMRHTHGTFKIGIEFRNWGREGDRYIHPFGVFGEPWGGVEFQHHWVRARLAGQPVAPFQEYSYAVAACRGNAFEFPNLDLKSIRSTYSYAYHFDASLYADFLRKWAIQQGVRRIEGQVRDIALHGTDGDIESLTLKSGVQVNGDLFVDCSGFRSLLLGDKLETQWEDWSHWLPCDRALAVPCERASEFTPYTRSTAQTGGWTWRIPLQHRTGNGYVFSSNFISEEQARKTLLNAMDGAPRAEPKLLKFRAGRRVHAWQRNCVAIGLASGFLEPLESTSIFLIQAAVIDLLRLLPSPDSGGIDARLRNEFNRLSDIQYERVRDFLILHYFANQRVGEPLWDHVRHMSIPDSLVHKINLFASRGHVPYYKDGLFSRDSWLSVLFGQGLMPRGYDRVADLLDRNDVDMRLHELHGRIATNVAAMSQHSDFVARYCAESTSTPTPARVAV
ncbi:MAG TPA: tryptophan halogenase family protein [Povalibacter sp.]